MLYMVAGWAWWVVAQYILFQGDKRYRLGGTKDLCRSIGNPSSLHNVLSQRYMTPITVRLPPESNGPHWGVEQGLALWKILSLEKNVSSSRSWHFFFYLPMITYNQFVATIYCKFINVCEGFICRISRPSLSRKNKYPANIIHVPRQLTRPKVTTNINPREHGFVSKTQTLIPVNINEFRVFLLAY